MKNYVFETHDLTYTYPDGTAALRGVNLALEKGRKIVVLGANGAGKSTLFLHFNGILRPTGGRIFFEGKEISYKRGFLTELRRKVGIVFQDPDTQIFNASVLEEVAFGPLNLDLPRAEVERRVQEAMQDAEITDLKERPVQYLSHGQKKQVSLAGVLAMQPEVLILDEPTAGLDPKLSRQMLHLFNHISRKGVTVILSTHDVDLAYTWADYIYILKDGQVAGEGSPGEVFMDGVLLENTGLSMPWLLEIYLFLQDKGLLKKELPVPRSKEDLYDLIVPVAGGTLDKKSVTK